MNSTGRAVEISGGLIILVGVFIGVIRALARIGVVSYSVDSLHDCCLAPITRFCSLLMSAGVRSRVHEAVMCRGGPMLFLV